MQKVTVSTSKREELIDITSSVEDVVIGSGVLSGLCVLYCPHTTAAITVNEGADPAVAKDMVTGLGRIIPTTWDFSHMEGNSDAHIKASMMGFSLNIIIDSGRLVLGTWQGVYFCEFDGPRMRKVWLRVISQS